MIETDAKKDWFDNDQLFIEELHNGHNWAEKVAGQLNAMGINCSASPLSIRPTIGDRFSYANEQDILLHASHDCLEVKSRRLSFGDDPTSYPYPTAFVDTASGWARKTPRPLAVMLISQITSSILVIPSSTAPMWSEVTLKDRVRNIEETWLATPRDAMTTLNTWAEHYVSRNTPD